MGPIGPAGPGGPQGPAGPAGAAGVSGYEVVWQPYPAAPQNVAALTTITGSATCPAGKVAIGGGFETVTDGSYRMPHIGSFPSASVAGGTLDRWNVSLRNVDTLAKSNVQIRVYALCASAQ
jgi:hypothetical protein